MAVNGAQPVENAENYDVEAGNQQACFVTDPATGDILIFQPENSLTQVIDLQDDQKYVFDFSPSVVAAMTEENGNLTIDFINDSRIVLNNFDAATSADAPALLTTDAGEIVAPTEFVEILAQIDPLEAQDLLGDVRQEAEQVASIDENLIQQVADIEPAAGAETQAAEQLAQIEPAAGDAAGVAPGRGYGFQSSFAPAGILPLTDIGPINPTALQYGLPQFDDQNLLLLAQTNSVPVGAVLSPLNVDETDLDNNGTEGDASQLVVDFGADGPGTFFPTGTFNATGSLAGGDLTSDGELVTVTLVGDQYIGAIPNGTPVFTLTINPDGTYNFNLLGPLDHADGTDPNDIITLNFGITAQDNDGDNLLAVIPVNVFDDAPDVQNSGVLNVDETDLDDNGSESASGNLTVDYGLDGAGAISLAGANSVTFGGSVAGGNLTSNGQAVTITQNGNQYVGTAGGQNVFTFTIDANGNYTFNLLGPLDHADTTTPDDVITMGFGVTVTDGDGDAVQTTIEVAINDDGPVAVNDVIGLGQNQTVANGNVLANDDAGLDDNPVVTTPGTFTGTYGTLVLNADGSYTYTLTAVRPSNDVSDVFTYTMVDGDGDPSTAQLTINIAGNDIPQNIQPDALIVDETDLDDNGNESASGNVTADFGNDGPGTFEGNGAFSFSGSATGGNLTSCGFPVSVSFANGQYTGTANGQDIFTLILNSNGSYTFNLLGQLDHADGNNPNDAILLNFGVTARDADGDTGTGTIQVTVQDDAPQVNAQPITLNVDETDLPNDSDSGVINFDYGLDGEGSVLPTGAGTFTFGGSVAGGQLTSNGNPVTVSVVNGNQYVGTANGQTIFTLSFGNDGSYIFNLLDTLDHADPNNPNDVINLGFGVTITDKDGDSVQTTINVNVFDDGPQIIGSDALEVDETDLDNNGTETDSGQINVNFGANGPGSFEGNDTFSFSGSVAGGNLTHCGFPVSVSWNGSEYVGTANGQNIFTLSINSNGSYTFNLLGALDHADTTNPDDAIQLNFGVTARDSDGNTLNTTIEVTVRDDGPEATGTDTLSVDETIVDNTGSDNDSGSITFDYGLDGAGDVAFNNNFTFSGVAGGQLTSGGVPVTVALNGNQYVATAGGQDIFTMTLNSNGSYTFNLVGPVDHANTNSHNDVINLGFGVTITDKDGDSINTTVNVNLFDDGPQAANDVLNVPVNQTTASGNVLANDDAGLDGNATVTTTGTFAGQYGTLTLNANGSYTYVLNPGVSGSMSDVFTYTMIDGDGDSDSATLTINSSTDDTPQNLQTQNLLVDETDLDENGSESDSGTVTANFGNDGPGTFEANGAFSFGGSATGGNLTSDGVPVTVSLFGSQYIGSANGQIIFTLNLNSNGNYTFNLLGALDHADGSNPNDAIQLNFGVTARDADGDTANATIQVTVLDDGPDAFHTFCEVDETNFGTTISISGQLTQTNGQPVSFGLDGPGAVVGNNNFFTTDSVFGNNIALTSGGQPVSVAWNGTQYAGTAGGQTIFTLLVNNDGTYTYTQFGALDHPDGNDANDMIVLNFGVRVTDNDTDAVDTTIQVHVYDDGPQIIGTDALSVDESNLPGESDNGAVTVDFGADGNGGVSATGANTFGFGGSVAGGNLTSNGQPVTVSVINGNYVGVAGGQTIFTLTINNNGTYSFDLFGELDHADPNNPNDIIQLFFGVTVEDGDGDSDTGTITVNVFDDGPTIVNDVPNIDDDLQSVDESNFGSVLIANGSVNADFGNDGQGSLGFTGSFSASQPNGTALSLTSGGIPVAVSLIGGDYVGIANGQTIFTLSLNGNSGNYQFRLFEPLDHWNPNNNDEDIALRFGVQITDGNGDTDTSTITVNVGDDGPDAFDTFCEQFETHLGYNINGQLAQTNGQPVDFGADGGVVSANNIFSASYTLYGAQQSITSNGQAVSVSLVGDQYVGIAGGQTIFTLTVRADGTYTYNQQRELDHSPTTGTRIYLNFGVDVVDGDGDTDSATILVYVNDFTYDSQSATQASVTSEDLQGLDNIGAVDEPSNEPAIDNVIDFTNNDVQASIDEFVANGSEPETLAANNNEPSAAANAFSVSANSDIALTTEITGTL